MTVKDGYQIGDEEATTIAKHVASAANIPPESIEISDQFGFRYQTAERHQNLLRQDKVRFEYERRLSSKAEELLETVVGPGNASVKVNVELEYQDEESRLVDWMEDRSWTREEKVKTSNEKKWKASPRRGRRNRQQQQHGTIVSFRVAA